MPKRNESLKSDQAFWIYKPNGKGFTVYSSEQLARLTESGYIKPEYRVGIRTAKGNF